MTIDSERQTGRTTRKLIEAVKTGVGEALFSATSEAAFRYVVGHMAEALYLRNLITNQPEKFGNPQGISWDGRAYKLTLTYGWVAVEIGFTSMARYRSCPEDFKAYRGRLYFDHAANRG